MLNGKTFEKLEFKFPPLKENIAFSDNIPPFILMMRLKSETKTMEDTNPYVLMKMAGHI